ncbi:MAG: threonine synthase [Oscillospiraceae bacterium]|nr:threonine synthase [Oscillospiraceae bacterium]
MKYTSTRNSTIDVTASEAIVKGISEEGGLFVPSDLENLPKFSPEDLSNMAFKQYNSYQEIAFEVLKAFLNFDDESLQRCINDAYRVKTTHSNYYRSLKLGYEYGTIESNFNALDVARLVKLKSEEKQAPAHILELWHGPTAAFKDMALQILPRMLKVSRQTVKDGTVKTLILVATSGDTGKAALEGFKNAEDTEIIVFYPEDGVSEMQKLQMTTQEGDNVHVFAVKGNFDDCQNAVKELFADKDIVERTKKVGVSLSSANSINWGRLCPQIVYYVSSYVDLVRSKAIQSGDKINICVPTGNFGNILAAYYAMLMGVPVNRLICASNSNNVLSDFINTGAYDSEREFHTTVSPSMDILVSSNLERLLYHLSDGDDKQINKWFADLKKKGKFAVNKKLHDKISSFFFGGWCSEIDTAKTIKAVFNEHGYLMDTHTAVGYKVWQDYVNETGDNKTKTIIASTANPYKFGDAVYNALYGEYIPDIDEDEESDENEVANQESSQNSGDFEYVNVESCALIAQLSKRTDIGIPKALSDIVGKEVRFNEVLDKSKIKDAVLKIL